MVDRLYGLFNAVPPQFDSHLRAEPLRPDVVLDSDMTRCWPMAGTSGFITIQLRQFVLIDSITIEHLPSYIVRNNGSTSLKSFRVEGLTVPDTCAGFSVTGQPIAATSVAGAPGSGNTQAGVLNWVRNWAANLRGSGGSDAAAAAACRCTPSVLIAGATFKAPINLDSIQKFDVPVDARKPYQLIKVSVDSNWGAPDYTCLYRIRVHGTPANPPLPAPPAAAAVANKKK